MDSVEFLADPFEAFRLQQKALLIIIIKNHLNDIGCGSVIPLEIANSLLNDLCHLSQTEFLENDITSVEFCDVIMSSLK